MKRKSGAIPNEQGPGNDLHMDSDEGDAIADEKVSRRQKIKANIWIWHRRLMFWGGSNK